MIDSMKFLYIAQFQIINVLSLVVVRCCDTIHSCFDVSSFIHLLNLFNDSLFINGVILGHQIRYHSIRPFSGTRQVFIEIIVFVDDLLKHLIVTLSGNVVVIEYLNYHLLRKSFVVFIQK